MPTPQWQEIEGSNPSCDNLLVRGFVLLADSASISPAQLASALILASDPTAGGGAVASLNTLLIRTDVPSIYYKSGAADTAWTLAGLAPITIASDPTLAGGFVAPLKSMLVRTDVASVYYKSGAANTAWTLVGVASPTTTAWPQLSPIISPGTLGGGATANYSPTGFSTAQVIRVVLNVGATLSGFDSLGIADGHQFLFQSVDTADTLTIQHDNAGSSAANRIMCPGNVNFSLTPGGSVLFWYDNTSSRWRFAAAA